VTPRAITSPSARTRVKSGTALFQQTYANYEVARARPAVSMLPTRAELFGVSVDELYDWIRESTLPSGPEDNQRGGYGLQWWTFANTGAFAAIGPQGQCIDADPAMRTVVVKLSYFLPGDNSALDAETVAFVRAVSAWKPH